MHTEFLTNNNVFRRIRYFVSTLCLQFFNYSLLLAFWGKVQLRFNTKNKTTDEFTQVTERNRFYIKPRGFQLFVAVTAKKTEKFSGW